MLNKKIPAGREFFYGTIELCGHVTRSHKQKLTLTAGFLFANFALVCYTKLSNVFEDPCRKGLSFMRNLLTISTLNDKNYRETMTNWLERDVKILSCGTHYDDGDIIWWAIGETDMPIKETSRINSRGSKDFTVEIDDDEYKKMHEPRYPDGQNKFGA